MEDTYRKITFTIDGERVEIERRYTVLPGEVILALVGTFDRGAGQIDGHLASVSDDETLHKVLFYWREYHLKPIPEAIRTDLENQIDRLNQARLGETPSVHEAPELGGDIFDSEDAVRALEIYRAALIEVGYEDPDTYDFENTEVEEGYEKYEGLVEEFLALKQLNEDGEIASPDWYFGERLIRDSHFEEFAREFAEDTGMIASDIQWPNNCIDWKKAAEELKQDYTEIEFKGETYWIR